MVTHSEIQASFATLLNRSEGPEGQKTLVEVLRVYIELLNIFSTGVLPLLQVVAAGDQSVEALSRQNAYGEIARLLRPLITFLANLSENQPATEMSVTCIETAKNGKTNVNFMINSPAGIKVKLDVRYGNGKPVRPLHGAEFEFGENLSKKYPWLSSEDGKSAIHFKSRSKQEFIQIRVTANVVGFEVPVGEICVPLRNAALVAA